MEEVAPSLLSRWESFYVIVGSSAAALTGLMFVVIALVAERRFARSAREVNAFGTPTVVHFSVVLFVSAVLSAPWRSPSNAALVVLLCGALGLAYEVIVFRRARTQTGYQPVLEDWVWHIGLPVAAYGALVAAGLMFPRHPHVALFVVGAAALLKLFIGIHNAWDTVIYIAIPSGGDQGNAASGSEGGQVPPPGITESASRASRPPGSG